MKGKKKKQKKTPPISKNKQLALSILKVEQNDELSETEKFTRIEAIIQDISESDFYEIDSIIQEIGHKKEI